MEIRQSKMADLSSCRDVCIITGPHLKSKKAEAELCLLYCDYYIIEENQFCYIVADEWDNAKGYVFCASNYQNYEKVYRKKYLPQLYKLSFFKGLSKSIDLYLERRIAKTYPAHLHIDLSIEIQRRGYGHQLIDSLLLALAKAEVKGVYLIVGANNKKGVNFYKKYGFKQVDKFFGGLVFALTIAN